MNAEFSSENDVLDIPMPAMIYTSPLAIVELPELPMMFAPPPPPPVKAAPVRRPDSLAFVRQVAIAAIALVCVLATTANASAPTPCPRPQRTMLSFHVDRAVDHHRAIAGGSTKHEYARTALVPPARRRR